MLINFLILKVGDVIGDNFILMNRTSSDGRIVRGDVIL